MESDATYMQIALEMARLAGQGGEVPVGAVLVSDAGEILARTHNETIQRHDSTAHAEILAIRVAGAKLANYRLLKTVLFVTIEPCIMCMGALTHARVQRIVFGAYDPKWGAAGSLYDLSKDRRLNHQTQITPGVAADQCRYLLQDFFRSRRGQSNIPDTMDVSIKE